MLLRSGCGWGNNIRHVAVTIGMGMCWSCVWSTTENRPRKIHGQSMRRKSQSSRSGPDRGDCARLEYDTSKKNIPQLLHDRRLRFLLEGVAHAVRRRNRARYNQNSQLIPTFPVSQPDARVRSPTTRNPASAPHTASPTSIRSPSRSCAAKLSPARRHPRPF